MRCYAIRIHETGSPEKQRWEEVEVGDPSPGQVLLRQTAVGLNYIDTYHRNGVYPVPLPGVPGVEGAAASSKCGPRSVTSGGRPRGYVSAPLGACAQWRLNPVERLVNLPDDIPDRKWRP